LFQFDTKKYPADVQALLSTERICELGPGRENDEALPMLEALSQDSFQDGVADRQMAQCCISGLWLLHDYLDRSHTISQDIDSAAGSYWHAIMHRREPDYSNSKYWFRRVGDHPAFATLAAVVESIPSTDAAIAEFGLLKNGDWDAFAFVDACQSVAKWPDAGKTRVLQEIAQAEWRILFDYCYNRAVDG